jgi:hypothetical protein
MNKINFVVVELCDNDYGRHLRDGLRKLIDESGGVDFCPVIARKYMVEYIVAMSALKHILNGDDYNSEGLRNYLQKLRVTFRDKLPTYDIEGERVVDHDGGSVYYNVNLDQVHSF